MSGYCQLIAPCPKCRREVPVNALRRGGFFRLRYTHCRACEDAAYAFYIDNARVLHFGGTKAEIQAVCRERNALIAALAPKPQRAPSR